MSRTDDFGYHREEEGSDRSQTAEDATLHGQPVEEAVEMGEASSADPALFRSEPGVDEPESDPANFDDGPDRVS